MCIYKGVSMAKDRKTGGRTSVDGEPKSKKVAVRESVKPSIERFRDLLDNAEIAPTAIAMLDDLEEMAKKAQS